jgi:Protein of unknown function (DUF2785)
MRACDNPRVRALAILAVFVSAVPAAAQPSSTSNDSWLALARSRFALPEGRSAIDLLIEMNPLLASDDPALRDDVAYSAAERWILRDRRVPPADLRKLLELWTKNLEDGLGEARGDRVFKRSFSALCLSLIAAADLSQPFLEPAEARAFFDRMLDYFQRERDLRGFDQTHGWMHTVAHTSDTLKFLSRNPKLAAGSDVRLLAAVRAKIEAHDGVFAWGENDRMALALHSAVRRADADSAALSAWIGQCVAAHQELWSKGPQVDPHRFALVENAKQVMRSLHAALSMDANPTSTGDAARQALIAALAKMR